MKISFDANAPYRGPDVPQDYRTFLFLLDYFTERKLLTHQHYFARGFEGDSIFNVKFNKAQFK